MKTIFTLFTFFIGLNTFSQITISGNVKDKKETIVGANIYLNGTYDGTSSDLDGNFSFNTLEKDTQVLKIEFVGYEAVQKTIFIENENLEFNFILKEAFNEVNAVTITAGSFEAGDKKKTVTLNSIDQITVAGAQGDVTGALQTLPGTTTVGESGQLFVRGGSSEESSTFIDGTKVFKAYSSTAPNLSTRGRFNPFMFKGTVFSTGGYSAEYGGALSSVLLLETNDLQVKDQLDLSIMSIGLDAAGTKTWKKGAVTASAAYTDLTPYMFLFTQKDIWYAPPKSFAGSVNLRQKTMENGMFKFFASYDNTFFNVAQKSVNDTTTRDNFALTNNNLYTNASWKGRLNDNMSIKVGASFNYDNDKMLINGNRVIQAIRGNHLKIKLKNHFSAKFKLNYGVEYLNNSYTQTYEDRSDSLIFKFNNNTYSAFAEADIYTSTKFVMRIGLRTSYADYIKKLNIAPRLSMAYKFNKEAQLSLAYGMFYQNPKDEYLLYTNDLKQERADHYMLNFQYDKKGRSIRAEVYYKDYRNLVKITDDRFYLPSSYNNEGKGYAYGLDLFYRDKKSIKNGDFWVSYSYINSKRDFRDFPTLATPNFVSTHNLSLVYKHWISSAKSFVSATYQYSSPRVYTNPNIEGFNNQKMMPYNNLSLAWTYLYRQNVIFFASCTNVLGFKQEFGYRYSDTPDANGVYQSQVITPGAPRFVFMGCFITLSKDKMANQVDKVGL